MQTELPLTTMPPSDEKIKGGYEFAASLSRPSMRATALALVYMLLVFCVYLHTWPRAPYVSEDTPGYESLAADLKHATLTQMHGRTPGFPIFLLMTGADQNPNRLFYGVSLALHFAAVGLLAYLLFVLEIQRGWIVAFGLIACLPPFVEWAAQMSTEDLSQFLLVATFVLLIGWLATHRMILLWGYSLAAVLAALTRPTFQGETLVVAGCLLGCRAYGILQISLRKLILSMTGAVLISAAVLGGYSAINYFKFGYFGTSIFPAYATSHKVVGVLEFLPDKDADIREILIRHRNALMADPNSDHTGQNYIYRALPELLVYFHGDRVKALKTVQDVSVELIKAKPMSYLNECAKAIAVYWMPTDRPLSGNSPIRRALWAAVELAILGLFFVQALALTGYALFNVPGVFSGQFKQPRPAGATSLVLCSYITGSALIWYTMFISCFAAIGLARYRVPTDLVIMVVTIIGYDIWRSRLVTK